MNRLRSITLSETREILRLANRLHATPDPLLRKQAMLQGLCDMVKGAAGSCIVQQNDPISKRKITVSDTSYVAPGFDPPRSIEAAHRQATRNDSSLPIPNATPALQCTLWLADATVCATIRLYRDTSNDKRLSSRASMLVDLFHSEMSWIYQADVVLTSANAMSLAPRARQTLELLLAGLAEKQIASKLRLSPNTVHHYVKSIHRHFGVSSRSELLARWVGK